jgi:hypothetical protein
MATIRKTITVYAGSADNLDQVFMDTAYALGKAIAVQGRQLVFGSGKTGLMGAVARGAMDNGGEVIGIINDDLNLPGLVFDQLTRIEEVPNIQIRQARMNELGDAFVALPGGFGTLYETLEALTWAQIGHHTKPIGILNVQGYYDPILSMLDLAIEKGFIYPEHRGLYRASADPLELLQALDDFTPPENMNRWLVRE